MIDWFTVAAQIVNFLILVGLLKYFLYGRILAAMDERQKKIESLQSEARREREETEKQLEEARRKNRDLDAQREQMLVEVRDEVEQHRQELTANVRQEAEQVRERWAVAIREETASFLSDLRRRASEEVCSVARSSLRDLADASLENQIIEHFLEKVCKLDQQHRQSVIDSLLHGDRVAIVQTSNPLTEDQQQRIETTLKSQLLADLEIQFEQSSDLLCGIALQTNAHKLAWNLRDYLIELEQNLQQALDEESAGNNPSKAEPIGAEG